MARKPLSELSPAYRRRVERAEAKGLSRQAARGHKVAEHVERRAREYREAGRGKVSSSQLQSVRPFFIAQIGKSSEHEGEDAAEVWRELIIPMIRERGFSWAVNIRAEQRLLQAGMVGLRRRRGLAGERAGAAGGGVAVAARPRLIGDAATFWELVAEPLDAEPWMLFYH